MQKPIDTKIEEPVVTLPETVPTSEDDFAKLIFEFVDFSRKSIACLIQTGKHLIAGYGNWTPFVENVLYPQRTDMRKALRLMAIARIP